MACLSAEVIPHLEKQKVLFGAFRSLDLNVLGIYLLKEGICFELLTFAANNPCTLKTKKEIGFHLKSMNFKIVILEFDFSQALKKFFLFYENHEKKVFLVLLEHNQNENNFVINQE